MGAKTSTKMQRYYPSNEQLSKKLQGYSLNLNDKSLEKMMGVNYI